MMTFKISITSGLILLQLQKANTPEIRAWLNELYNRLAADELFATLPEAAAAFPLPQDLSLGGSTWDHSPFRPLILAKCQELFDITDADRHLRSLNVHMLCNRKSAHTAHRYHMSRLNDLFCLWHNQGLYQSEESQRNLIPAIAPIVQISASTSSNYLLRLLIKHEEMSNDS